MFRTSVGLINYFEIQNWVLKFGEFLKNYNLYLKALSGFYITLTDIKNETLWAEFLQDHINTETVYPQVFSLKLKSAELAVENGVLEIVKDYSNDFIEFFINYIKKD